MASIKLKGDTSGELTIQAPSVAGTNTLNLPASSGTLATTAQASIGMKNRIINGNMAIDQRNAGTSVTPTTTTFALDRWACFLSQASKFSVQQNAGAITSPAGFINYLGATSLSAYSVLSSDNFNFRQKIEGYNIADLNWGTANAKTVTISFWVRSSLTGTFGGAIKNSASTRSYPFNYTISVANTWEQKTITVAGDTTGTWLTTNGIGMQLIFSLGTGATYSGTAGAWAATNYLSATGAVSVVGTNGATLYITGVQLEVGTTATDFENLQYGQQLALCQRYYETNKDNASAYYYSIRNDGISRGLLQFVVPKRAAPTVTLSVAVGSGSFTNLASALASSIYNADFGHASNYSSFQKYEASAEL
jgi:hypothetical protein